MGFPKSIQDVTNNYHIHISHIPPSTHEMLTHKGHVDDLNSKQEWHTLDAITSEQKYPTPNICTHDQEMVKSRDISKKNNEED